MFCDNAIIEIRGRYRRDFKDDFTLDFDDQSHFLPPALYLRLKQWGIVDLPLNLEEMIMDPEIKNKMETDPVFRQYIRLKMLVYCEKRIGQLEEHILKQ